MRAGSGVRARNALADLIEDRAQKRGSSGIEHGRTPRKSCCRAIAPVPNSRMLKHRKIGRHYCTLTWSQMEVAAGRLLRLRRSSPAWGSSRASSTPPAKWDLLSKVPPRLLLHRHAFVVEIRRHIQKRTML